MNRDTFFIFEIASKYCILDSFVDYDGCSISSKGFLPTVVVIIIIWVKFTHSSPSYFAGSWNVDAHFCHLLFDHFQFALIHGPNIPGSYAIWLFIASNPASITSPIHNWVLFLLWLHPFILSGVTSPLISSSIGHLPTWGVPLSVSCHFAFLYCSWGSQGKNTEVVFHSLLQWTTFCQISPPWPVHLGWPHMAWLSFTELDKAAVV